MNGDFSRILTLLRKERGISQKQAAADLGVSQALLSHYENGIRECGLTFVVRVADYYGVSCDYLLGRSPTPGNSGIKSGTENTKEEPSVIGAARLLLTLSKKIGNQTFSRQIEQYLSSAVYRIFRKIYRVYPRNEESFFTVPEPRAELRARCQMEEAAAEAEILAKDSCGEAVLLTDEREKAMLTTDILVSEYGEDGSAMLLLVKEEEALIKSYIP